MSKYKKNNKLFEGNPLNSYRCPYCKTFFRTYYALKEHIREHPLWLRTLIDGSSKNGKENKGGFTEKFINKGSFK